MLYNVVTVSRSKADVHRKPIAWVEKCRAKGLPIFAQCATGRAGFAFTLEHWNLYDASPAWRAVTTGTKAEKIEKMRDPELRQALVEEAEEADRRLQVIQAGVGGDPARLVIQGVNRQADLQQYVGRSVGEIAEAEGKHPIEVMLDLSLAGDLNVEFLGPDRGSNAEFMAEMMSSPYAIPGVSDGGAHTKFFTGGAYSTDFLTWLVRDEGVITLEEAHYRLSNLAAQAAGFQDRGVLRQGAAADVLVYDLEELAIEPPWIGDVEYDLPGGEWRRVQRAQGLPADHRQRRGHVRGRRVHRRHAGQPAARREGLTLDGSQPPRTPAVWAGFVSGRDPSREPGRCPPGWRPRRPSQPPLVAGADAPPRELDTGRVAVQRGEALPQTVPRLERGRMPRLAGRQPPSTRPRPRRRPR